MEGANLDSERSHLPRPGRRAATAPAVEKRSAVCPECGQALPGTAGPPTRGARAEVGPDGLARWEREALDRYANTREPGHLNEVRIAGSAEARRRAQDMLDKGPPAESAAPAPAEPRQWLTDAAREALERLRRRGAERGENTPSAAGAGNGEGLS